jgi:hypothetical protein
MIGVKEILINFPLSGQDFFFLPLFKDKSVITGTQILFNSQENKELFINLPNFEQNEF